MKREDWEGYLGVDPPKLPSNVIPIRKPPKPIHEIVSEKLAKKKVKGWAVCAHCQHKWEAESWAGCSTLQCPKCHGNKGLYLYGHQPQYLFNCECICNVFSLGKDPDGRDYLMCWDCGNTYDVTINENRD